MNIDHAIALLAPDLLRRQGQVFRGHEAVRSGRRHQLMAKYLVATSAGRSVESGPRHD